MSKLNCSRTPVLAVALAAMTAAGGAAGALSAAAQARPGAKHHAALPRMSFGAWGVRTMVNSQPKVAFTTASQFSHCRSQPVVRLTANFHFSGIASGTKLTDTWYAAGQRYTAGSFTVPPLSGNVLSFVLTSSPAIPDQLITLKVFVHGKAVGAHSLRLVPTAC